MLKKSFFPLALSSIVLFASLTPVLVQASHTGHPEVSRRTPGQAMSISINSKKRPLTWKQKLRKNFRKIKEEVSEFVGEHPVATVASIVGTAIAAWFVWEKLSNPWIHRNQAVGDSACDIIEAVVQPGYQREIVHNIFQQEPVLDQEALARGERVWRDGEPRNILFNARFHLNNQAQILQLRSANQAPGGSCAYHAIKNCMVILNELAQPQGDLQLQLEGEDLCDRLFGAQGVWRHMMLAGQYVAQGDCFEDGDWLSGNAVRDIINHEYDNHQLLEQGYARNLIQIVQPRIAGGEVVGQDQAQEDHSPITVVEDANRINNPNPAIDVTRIVRAELAEALRANQAYTHGFIFNTARTINGRVPRRDNGHWLAAVLHCTAEGNIRWYVANSFYQRSILDLPTLRDLIAAVQGAQAQ